MCQEKKSRSILKRGELLLIIYLLNNHDLRQEGALLRHFQLNHDSLDEVVDGGALVGVGRDRLRHQVTLDGAVCQRDQEEGAASVNTAISRQQDLIRMIILIRKHLINRCFDCF